MTSIQLFVWLATPVSCRAAAAPPIGGPEFLHLCRHCHKWTLWRLEPTWRRARAWRLSPNMSEYYRRSRARTLRAWGRRYGERWASSALIYRSDGDVMFSPVWWMESRPLFAKDAAQQDFMSVLVNLSNKVVIESMWICVFPVEFVEWSLYAVLTLHTDFKHTVNDTGCCLLFSCHSSSTIGGCFVWII